MNSLSQPNFFANASMIAWSVCDSNIGVITRSRHCSARFDAVTDPEVSNCVHAGSRYTARFGLAFLPASLRIFCACSDGGIAAIAAVADGYGAITHSKCGGCIE